jgi:tartrate dehydrogenase/decarboxylase/D-malate dehydrogenase
MSYDIAVIPGDGVGNEVIEAVVPFIRAAANAYNVKISTESYDWGSNRYLQAGTMMPDDGLEQLESHDSILLGAVGHPDIPDHITLHGLRLTITKGFNQHICKRPSALFEGIESPLRGYDAGDIDLVVYRQNTEGEYSHVGGHEHQGFENEVAIQSAVFTREGTEQIVRAAFEAAEDREQKVTNVTKSNAQAYGMVFWDEIVEEISTEYPNIRVERLLVDAASMNFVRRPEEFDVVVASNLFGDILTDLGAIISGSIGLAPSSNINPSGEYPSMFEPVHGSAFDIMGEGIANPLGTVLSCSLMFENLEEQKLADALWQAVAEQLADSKAPRTPDVGGEATTDAVVSDLESRLLR